MFGISGANLRRVELSHTANAVSTTDLTTYTFSSQALGAAHSNRKIVVAIIANDTDAGTTISTVTVGGVSASVVSDGTTTATADAGSGNTRISAQYLAAVPTGTTGDIVITFSGAMINCAITVYRLVNARTQAFHVVKDTSITTNALSVGLNIPGFGAAIGGVLMEGDGTARTASWVGLTEDTDATIESDDSYSTANKSFAMAQSSLTVTVTASGTIDQGALVTASFKPL